MVSPINGARYPSLEAYCDHLALTDGWYEWICCAGDTGYATILLVPETHVGDTRVDGDVSGIRRARPAVGDRWKVLAVTHLLAAGAGFALAPRDILDEEVAYTGLFSVQERRTIAAAVLSLKKQNKTLGIHLRRCCKRRSRASEFLACLPVALV